MRRPTSTTRRSSRRCSCRSPGSTCGTGSTALSGSHPVRPGRTPPGALPPPRTCAGAGRRWRISAVIPVLETGRLVLRPLVASDATALFTFRSDPIEQRWNDAPLTEQAQAGELIDRLAVEHHTAGALHWGLTLRGDDTVRGLL